MTLHPSLIIIFFIVVVGLLALDLGLFNKKSHEISNKEATIWSVVWISLSMLFSGAVYFIYGQESHAIGLEKFSQFQSAYWIEKALSVDNLFVFILVFNFFKVPKALHHTVLSYGIFGAIIMRAIFIWLGVGLIKFTYINFLMELCGSKIKFIYDVNIVMTLFGGFLLYAGFKTLRDAISDEDEDEEDFSKSVGARLISKMFKGRVLPEFHDNKFVVKKTDATGKLVNYATMLFIVVGVIEITDLLFAVDSIPAIFAIAPDDPFILYTSNIFAILGLRSLYFLLANFMHMFKYLPYGLSVILSFIGIKMLITPIYHIESTLSLLVVVGILVLSVVTSLLFKDDEPEMV